MTIPEDDDKLAPFTEKVIEGYKENAEEWDVPMSYAKEAQRALNEFTQKDVDFRAVAAQLTEILIPACQEADRLVEQILKASNKAISLKVGERYNEVWAEAGHLNESTRIPDRMEDRIVLLKKLKAFYTKRSDWQSPDFGLTVEKLSDCAAAIDAAHKAVKAQESVKTKLLKECNRSAKRLRSRLRALLGEVKHALAADDERWSELGLSTPASYRASKETRERKAQLKTQARAEQLAVNGRKRAETAKAAYEKARVRAEASQVATDKLKETARKLALKAGSLFEKADELDEKVREGAAVREGVVLPAPEQTSRNLSGSEPRAIESTDSTALSS